MAKIDWGDFLLAYWNLGQVKTNHLFIIGSTCMVSRLVLVLEFILM